MDITTITQIITPTILGIAAVGGLVQLQKLTAQQRLIVFTAYTERYSRIMASLPFEAFDSTKSVFVDSSLSAKEKTELMTKLRLFFDLVSEEFYLYERHLLDKKVWRLWRRGLAFSMKSKTFQEVWKIIEAHEGYDEDFKALINTLLNQTFK